MPVGPAKFDLNRCKSLLRGEKPDFWPVSKFTTDRLPLCDILPVTSCAGGRHNIPRSPVTLNFDLLTLKMVSESRATWATSVPILVFLGLSVLDLGPMYATNRQMSDAFHRLMPPALGAGA